MTSAVNPRFSVIIPTHNRASLLEHSIDSILNQDFSDFEIIISDNNSTEENQKIAAGYAKKDSRIHYIYNPIGGLAQARNFGVRHSKGEIISFLDDDDLFAPNYLREVNSFLINNNDTEIVLVVFQRSDGKETNYIYPVISPPWLVLVGNGASLKRSVFDNKKLYYDDGLVVMEDVIFGFFAARNCKIGFISKPLLIYGRIEGDTSHNQLTNRYKLLEEQDQIVYKKYVKEYIAYSNKAGAWLNLTVGNLLAGYGNMAGGREYLRRALQLQFRMSHLYYYLFSFFPKKIFLFGLHIKLFFRHILDGYYLKNIRMRKNKGL
jgi:glycosyltransferase involved in cell wall biosynthesis